MIIPILMGGLGNQMFQIAAAQAHAIKMDDDFAIVPEMCYTPNQGFPTNRYSETIFRNFKKMSVEDFNRHRLTLYDEPHYHYAAIPPTKNLLLRGYFQSPMYFAGQEARIKSMFAPDLQTQKRLIDYIYFVRRRKPLVSLHVRRGDYIKFSHHHCVTSLDYFNEAMSKFDADFLVFSDDPTWCEKNLNENCVMFTGGNELDALYVMMLCDHNIISNSSFSWWAAFMNPNANHRVIYPFKWFTQAAGCDTKNLIPENWEGV